MDEIMEDVVESHMEGVEEPSSSLSLPETFPEDEELPLELQIEPEELRKLILQYLVHECYSDTARLLLSTCNMDPAMMDQTIEKRKKILDSLTHGKVEDAIAELKKYFPTVLSSDVDVHFSLECQVFIELLRERKVKEALTFAQEELGAFGIKDKKFLEPLQDIIALLAYDVPEASPVGGYMSESHRQSVAERLNSAMLQSLSMPPTAHMRQLMKQLTVVQNTFQQEEGRKGARWRLSEYLKNC